MNQEPEREKFPENNPPYVQNLSNTFIVYLVKDRLDECGIHLCHLLGTLDTAALHPPLHHQHKAARDVLDQKVVGQRVFMQERVPACGQCLAELFSPNTPPS